METADEHAAVTTDATLMAARTTPEATIASSALESVRMGSLTSLRLHLEPHLIRTMMWIANLGSRPSLEMICQLLAQPVELRLPLESRGRVATGAAEDAS